MTKNTMVDDKIWSKLTIRNLAEEALRSTRLSELLIDESLPCWYGYELKRSDSNNGDDNDDKWDVTELIALEFNDLIIKLNELLETDNMLNEKLNNEDNEKNASNSPREQQDTSLNGMVSQNRTYEQLSEAMLKRHRDSYSMIEKSKGIKESRLEHALLLLEEYKKHSANTNTTIISNGDGTIGVGQSQDEVEDLFDSKRNADTSEPSSSSTTTSDKTSSFHTWSVTSGQSAELIGRWNEYGISREELLSLLSLTPVGYRFPLLITGSVWLLSCEPYLIVSSDACGCLILTSGATGVFGLSLKEYAEHLGKMCEVFCIERNKINRLKLSNSNYFAPPPISNYCWWCPMNGSLSSAVFWDWLLSFTEHHLNVAQGLLNDNIDELEELLNVRYFYPPILKTPSPKFKKSIESLKKTTIALLPIEQLLGSSSEVWSLPIVYGKWGDTLKTIRKTLARPMTQMGKMLARHRDNTWLESNSLFDSVFFNLMVTIDKLEILYEEWDLLAVEKQVKHKNAILQMHSLTLSFDVIFGVASLIYSLGGTNLFELPNYNDSFLWYIIMTARFVITILLSVVLSIRSLMVNRDKKTKVMSTNTE